MLTTTFTFDIGNKDIKLVDGRGLVVIQIQSLYRHRLASQLLDLVAHGILPTEFNLFRSLVAGGKRHAIYLVNNKIRSFYELHSNDTGTIREFTTRESANEAYWKKRVLVINSQPSRFLVYQL